MTSPGVDVPEGAVSVGVLDEQFGHQLVAPRATTAYMEPTWAERSYFLLYTDSGVVLNAGRQLYPHAGRRVALTAASTERHQIGYRFAERVQPGDDPDLPIVGRMRVETVRPLHEIRLVLDAPTSLLEYDLTFEARFPPVLSQRNRIELREQVVTDYLNFFQSGRYSGDLRVGDEEHRVDGRAGFRDRGWGLRKHEGAPRRGMVVFVGCELPDRALYLLLYETAAATRVLTNGWIADASGSVDAVTEVTHELSFVDGRLTGGTMVVTGAVTGTHDLRIQPRSHLLLAATGYRREHPTLDPPERLDLHDPAVVAEHAGQTDYGCEFTVDGERGHGYVEIGLGVHARYQLAANGTAEQGCAT